MRSCCWAVALLAPFAHGATMEAQHTLGYEPRDVPSDKCGVVVSANEDDRLIVFAVGQDQQIYHKFQLRTSEAALSTDGFTFWSSLGGTFLDGPSVVRDKLARIVIFARGADRGIWQKTQARRGEREMGREGAGGWGERYSRPCYVADGAQRSIVEHMGVTRRPVRLGTSSPLPPHSLPTAPRRGAHRAHPPAHVQAPRAILNSEGFLHLFAKATDEGTLMHKFEFAGENGTCWSEWASLGGSLTSMPNVLLDAEVRSPRAAARLPTARRQ